MTTQDDTPPLAVGPVEAVRAAYRRIADADDPALFIHLRPQDEAMAEAENLERQGESGRRPLYGMPFAVKDNIDVAGMPTTAACPAFAYAAQRDAAAVARLRAAGAIPLGKTNLDQFATGLVGTRSPFGVPRNAVDPLRVPGGSSSGSAVAVARGIVPFALGTDTAGSGRVPAALNGIVGLKPSLGLVSTAGVVPACRTLDTVSVFARTLADAHAALSVMAGEDRADPFSRRLALRPPFAPDTVRLGVPDAADRVFADGAAAQAFAATLDALPALGITPVPVDFAPFHEVAALLYEGPWLAERYTVVADLLARQPDAVHPVTRQVIEGAEAFTAADAFRARHRLQALARQVETLMEGLARLLVPSVPGHPTLDAVATDPVGENARLGTYTNFVNLLDMCAATVPTAPDAAGRPGSVTVIAPEGADHVVAALGERIHAAFASPARRIAPHVSPVPGETAIAVVGAHMSGLPLNHELTSRGGRFLRAAATAPAYRLHALAGGPPKRPGLVRVETGGASIALEIWALPDEAVGDFLAGVPAPLAIGTVHLADGGAVKGFLCEAAGLAGAEDVTGHGGWRAYLAAGGAA